MAISVITGFSVKKSEPADVRETVANTTARLALQYPYKGLCVREADTGQIYRYITTTPVDGGLPTNVSGDWELVPTVFTGTGAPLSGKGVIGDIWIDETGFIVYKKTGASTWTSLFSISGAKIYTGVPAPDNGDGANGDMYVRSDGGVYTKAGGVWTLQFNIAGADGQSDTYATTSATSINLATATAPLNLTIGTGKSYTVGQTVVVASRADNDNNLTGDVVSYNSGSGALVLDNLTINGTGTHTDWDVNLSGSPGKQGKAFIHTEADINFNDTKVTTVEAGSWTPENPWSASVANDTRTSFIVPSELSGDKSRHSISYDGTSWYDNGVWTGPTGAQGPQGIQGLQGTQGIPGPAGVIPFSNLGAPLTIENLSKGWYFVDLLTNLSVIFGGNCELGTVVTVCRTTAGIDGAIPPDSSYTASITQNIQGSLNYKGRYVTTIPMNSRNITFIAVAQDHSRTYWKCVGEDADFVNVVKAAQGPSVNAINGIQTFTAGATVTSINSVSSSFLSNTFSIPKIEFRTGLRHTSTITVSLAIQYSNDNITFFDLKTTLVTLEANVASYFSISAIDTPSPGVTRYYRLRITSASVFRYIIDAINGSAYCGVDKTIYSILRP